MSEKEVRIFGNMRKIEDKYYVPEQTVDELVAWVKSKIEDRSHSCDATWRLVAVLDEVSQGHVGGYMDLKGIQMIRQFIQNEEAVYRVSREVYNGNMARNRLHG